MSDFFEATIDAGAEPKQASNWLMGEVSAYLNSEKLELEETKLTPDNLAGMIQLIADGTISSKIAKKVFKRIDHQWRRCQRSCQSERIDPTIRSSTTSANDQ